MNKQEQQVQQKVSEAQKLKQEGNKFFKQKEYIKALKQYHQSMLYLNGLIDKESPMSVYTKKILSEQLATKIKQLKFSIWMNMSQIYIYQSKYQKGLSMLTKAEQIKKNNKLKFRKAVLLMNLNRFQQAKKMFKEVVEADTTLQREVEEYLVEITKKEKKEDAKVQQMYTKFFEKQQKV